jgi:hypothetical protein
MFELTFSAALEADVTLAAKFSVDRAFQATLDVLAILTAALTVTHGGAVPTAFFRPHLKRNQLGFHARKLRR